MIRPSTSDVRRPIYALVVGAVIIAESGCDLHEYTPSIDVVKKSATDAFMVEVKDIVGLYGNTDVDSLIFAYRTTVGDAATFWTRIGKQASEQGWKLSKTDASCRRYEREGRHPSGMQYKELAAVAFRQGECDVLVGWVRADGEDGASFADNVLWPKFDTFRAERHFQVRQVPRPVKGSVGGL